MKWPQKTAGGVLCLSFDYEGDSVVQNGSQKAHSMKPLGGKVEHAKCNICLLKSEKETLKNVLFYTR